MYAECCPKGYYAARLVGDGGDDGFCCPNGSSVSEENWCCVDNDGNCIFL